MSHIKAEDILPRVVIELIQQYVDGATIYIPRKAENRRSWGCGTGYRAQLQDRDRAIREDHARGMGIEALADKYHLSEKSIRRILRGAEG